LLKRLCAKFGKDVEAGIIERSSYEKEAKLYKDDLSKIRDLKKEMASPKGKG